MESHIEYNPEMARFELHVNRPGEFGHMLYTWTRTEFNRFCDTIEHAQEMGFDFEDSEPIPQS